MGRSRQVRGNQGRMTTGGKLVHHKFRHTNSTRANVAYGSDSERLKVTKRVRSTSDCRRSAALHKSVAMGTTGDIHRFIVASSHCRVSQAVSGSAKALN